MKRAFTLLELIIVIIIVGILATVGLNQYTVMVERGRAGEARSNIGTIRKLAYEYYLKNGTLSTITAGDVGIGTLMPSSCATTNYFYYAIGDIRADRIDMDAFRCTSGGKTPNASPRYIIYSLYSATSGGVNIWCYTSDWSANCPY